MSSHHVHNDHLYRHYRGAPLELLLLKRDSSRDKVLMGRNPPSRKRVLFFIPGNTFRRALVIGQRRRFLAGSRPDIELGDAEPLAEKYPHAAKEMRSPPLSS